MTRFVPGVSSKAIQSRAENKVLIEENQQRGNSFFIEYISSVTNFIRLDFGYSHDYHQPVTKIIKQYFPFTLFFALTIFFFQIIFTIGFALLSFTLRSNKLDTFFSNLFLSLYSVPTFIIGISLISIFSLFLGILPTSGTGSYESYDQDFLIYIFEKVKYLILPVATLTITGVSYYYKFLREMMDEVSRKQFILALRAAGKDERSILLKNILPNSLSPFISNAGIELGLLLSGSLIVEFLFGLPGMGRITVVAILNRDYPLVVGCTVVASFVVLFANMTADIVRNRLNIRLEMK